MDCLSQEQAIVTSLALEYKASKSTIYNVLKLARVKFLKPQSSTNNRFKQAKYSIKRLAKVEKSIQDKLKRQAKRYNKSYPGEMLHLTVNTYHLCLKSKASKIDESICLLP